MPNAAVKTPELLAPAGGPEAAFAAFEHGADAVYLGLRNLSARDSAINFSADELAGIVAFAHSLKPQRAVYVTVNTLLRDADLHSALDTLEDVASAGADAVIVQDPAVARIASRFFPSLPLHASTQMAIANAAGAAAAREMGFSRVVLAREVPLDDIALIARDSGVEIEVFIHGALCYSYSGLCLFSSHASGRSGNRGRCAYCCRESFSRDCDGAPRPYFSMRDLSMLGEIPRLAEAGVASLKIEGRMKSAKYVAAVTDLYRRKLDRALSPDEEASLVSDLQTIFSRPSTELHAHGRATARSVIDTSAVGHRGAPLGTVAAVRRERGVAWLRFRSSRALERHDGIQVVIPGEARPYGFAALRLRLANRPQAERVETPPGADVEVALPPDAPFLPLGAEVFCGSSTAVDRRFRLSRMPELARPPRAADISATLARGGAVFEASAKADGADADGGAQNSGAPLFARVELPGPLGEARRPEGTEEAIRKAFSRMGGTGWVPGRIEVRDTERSFVPASQLNEARRELLSRLDSALSSALAEAHDRRARALDEMLAAAPRAARREREIWTAKLGACDEACELPGADEIILEIGAVPYDALSCAIAAWREKCGGALLRLALPPLVRNCDWERVADAAVRLVREGYRHWECADIAGLRLLRGLGGGAAETITADSPLAPLNSIAKARLAEAGVARVATSAEDDLENIASHAAAAPETEALAFQHTPLFIAETPPDIGIGAATAAAELAAWPREGVRFRDGRGRTLRTVARNGFAVTADERPFCATGALGALRNAGIACFRCDFRWLPMDIGKRRAVFSAVRSGEAGFDFHQGNLARGLQ